MPQTINKRIRTSTNYNLNRLKSKLKKQGLVKNDSDLIDLLISNYNNNENYKI